MKGSKQLGLFDLLALALGTVIGAGVVTTIGSAVGVTGRSAWLAFELAIVLGFIVTIPMCFASSMFRLRGGLYAITGLGLGKKGLGMFSVSYLVNVTQTGVFALGMGTYINSIIPALSVKAVAISIIVIVYLLNLFSLKSISKFQKYITILLTASLLLIIVVGCCNLTTNPFDMSTEDAFLGGSDGFFQAVALLVMSTQGYMYIVNYSAFAKNPKTDIPKIWAIVPIILLLIYGGVGIVAANVLPVDVVAGKPLTYVAKTLFPTPIFYLFIICGPCMALLSTLNGTFSSFSAFIANACEDGWFPKCLSYVNKNHQPVVFQTIAAVFSIVCIILGISLDQMISNVVLVTSLIGLIPVISILSFPRKYPEAWKKSTMHIPNGLYYAIIGISIAVRLLFAYWSIKGITTTAAIISVTAIIVFVLYGLLRSKSDKVQYKELAFSDMD